MCLGHEIRGRSSGSVARSARSGPVNGWSSTRGTTGWAASATGPAKAGSPPAAGHRRRSGAAVRVPDGLPLGVAAFAEPLAVGIRAVDQAEVNPGDGVAVFGCGPIGLAAVATLVDRGHRKVVAINLSPVRLELARGSAPRQPLDPRSTEVWDELGRLHGTGPFMFGPTPATSAFIEAADSPGASSTCSNTDRSVVASRWSPSTSSRFRPATCCWS